MKGKHHPITGEPAPFAQLCVAFDQLSGVSTLHCKVHPGLAVGKDPTAT
jgi:hypothetical protein